MSGRPIIGTQPPIYTFPSTLRNVQDLVNIIRRNPPRPDRIPLLKINNNNYLLTEDNRNRLLKNIRDNKFFVNIADTTGSDVDVIIDTQNDIINGKDIKVEIIYITPKNTTEGGFFPYYHKTSLDLSRYAIYKKGQTLDYTDNCFITALRSWGKIPENQINNIKSYSKNSFIRQTEFTKISKELGITIEVYKLSNDKKIKEKPTRYNAGCQEVLKLGLIENHYFLIEQLEITSYSLKNYDKLKHKNEWYKYFRINEKTNDRFINSFQAVKLLIQCNLVERIPREDIENTIYHDQEEYKSLNFDDNNLQKIEYNPKNNDYECVVYFDFETDSSDIHKPYMISYYINGETHTKIRKTNTDYFIIDFLNDIPNNSLCVAHNLGYDIKFLINYLTCQSIIQRSESSIIMFKGLYKKKTITFHCSYAMIPTKLSSFGKMFNLTQEKEVMPYKAYTEENIKKRFLPVKEVADYLQDTDKKQFLKNIQEWNLLVDDFVDIIKYSKIYCERDVLVLKEGFEKFRSYILEITNLDIMNYVSLASVAHDFLIKEGCYENCYSISGCLRDNIQKFVVGGRVMTAENKKYKLDKSLDDFDGVSLYPSSMHLFDGFIQGKPLIISDSEQFEKICKDKIHYFVRVNITKVNKNLKFPLLNRKNDVGVREFKNDLLGIHCLDRYQLEDLIEFQQIEYEFVDGYYFPDGYNPRIKSIIKNLFEERKIKKKQKNPIQEVYKLLMNSCYGKTALKPIEFEYKIVSKVRANVFIQRNYNKIVEFVELSNGNKIKIKIKKAYNKHFNECHIGASILSFSKRIMNEVMCLAEEHNIDMYYQDTDSIHLDKYKVEFLADKFYDKYNKKLIGDNLGQFHCDFEFQGSSENPYSVESIFLGKKCYLHKVKGIVDGEEVYKYHYRMKGIPHCVIDYESKNYKDVKEMYQQLYNGKEITFNLLHSTTFKSLKDGTIKTLSNDFGDVFERTLKF